MTPDPHRPTRWKTFTPASTASAVVVVALLGSVLVTTSSDHATTPPVATAPPVAPAPPSNPPASGFPDASSTGVPTGTRLIPSGPLHITKADTTLDALDITNGIVIDAPNITITRSNIHGTGNYGIQVASGNLTITDSTITGFDNCIGFDDWKAVRVEITGSHGDGAKLGSNVTLASSWIHDLDPAEGAHSDGAQVQSGVRDTTVTGNTINLTGGSGTPANSALFLAPDQGPSTDGPLTVTGNLLGGGNFTVYCVDGNDGEYTIGNITIADNTFLPGTSEYGPVRVNVPVRWSGNVLLGALTSFAP